MAMAAMLCFGVCTARADTLTFGAGCGDIFWHTCCDCGVNLKCNNWSVPASPAPLCPALPTGADDTIINSNCTIQALMTGITRDLTQSVGTFTIDGALSVAGTATFAGLVVWNSGTICRDSADGAHVVAVQGGMTIQGADPKFLGGNPALLNGWITLSNDSDITWSGEGNLTMGPVPGGASPATLHNLAASTFDAQNNAGILSTAFGLGVIVNDGTLQKSVAAGTSAWHVTLVNNNLVHVQSGELRLTGAGEASGEFRVEPGATLTFATAFNFEFKPGISFTGGGDAVLVDTGSGFGVLVKETIDLNRFRVTNSGAIGPTTNFGHINVTGLLQLDGAEITPPVTVKPGATLEHVGPNQSRLGDVFIEGFVDIVQGQLSTVDKTITVQPAGVVEIRDDASLRTAGLVNLPIQNNGTIRKTSGNGTAKVLADFFEWFFNNAGGLVHVATGTLDFDETNLRGEGGTWRIDTGTKLRAPGSFGQVFELNSGTVTGGGTLIVRRLNNVGGIVAPGDSPGTLTVAASVTPDRPGDYSQGADGVLAIEAGGLTPGTQHDRLVVAGTATLGGTLEVTLVNGFVPADGDAIAVLTAGFRTGEFVDVVGTNLPAGTTVAPTYDSTSVVLTFGVDDSNGNGNGNTNDNTNTNDNDNDDDNGNTNGNSNNNGNGNGNGNDNGDVPGPQPTGPDCGEGACGGGAAMMPLVAAWLGVTLLRRRRG